MQQNYLYLLYYHHYDYKSEENFIKSQQTTAFCTKTRLRVITNPLQSTIITWAYLVYLLPSSRALLPHIAKREYLYKITSVEQNRISIKRKLFQQTICKQSVVLFHKITSYLLIETGESVEAGSAWQSVVEKAGGPYWKDQDSSHCWETVWAWRPKPAWKPVT